MGTHHYRREWYGEREFREVGHAESGGVLISAAELCGDGPSAWH